jgi:hypothetical protein
VRTVLILLLRGYQLLVSPLLTALGNPLGLGCRFTPTCSHYALDALRQHGVWRGIGLTARRLGRCHPWGGCGHDPVPPATFPVPPEPPRPAVLKIKGHLG